MVHDYVYRLMTTGSDGFTPDIPWLDAQKQAGIACSHCGGVYPNRIKELRQIIVSNTNVLRIHSSSQSRLGGGITLSYELIDLIGRSQMRKSYYFVPIINAKGHAYDTHTHLFNKEAERGCVRGSPESNASAPALCEVCERLLYWPGNIPKKQYVLRQYWTEGAKFGLLDDFELCSAEFYETVIKPLKLFRLIAYKTPLVDEPKDGLPADYQALLAETRRTGLRR